MALRTIFCVGAQPIRRLAVVVALFAPLFEHFAINRLVPLVTARKAENNAAFARYRAALRMRHLRDALAACAWAPFETLITLKSAYAANSQPNNTYQDKTINDELFICFEHGLLFD